MKLLQLNIWGGRLDKQILKLVSDQKPDILCLQEVIDLKQGRAGLFVSADEIKDELNYQYKYMTPAFSFNYTHRKASIGNCIISKYPITEEQTIFTGLEYVEDFDWLGDSSNIRNLQEVTLSLPENKKLKVLNHHGHHIHQHKNGDNETMRQCAIIAKQVKSQAIPVILAGDFNLAPNSKSLNQINEVLNNLCIENNLKTTRTNLTTKTEVCDYIFVSQDIQVNEFKALDYVASDHQALVLDFKVH